MRIAVVPARGGSKRLPRKNVRQLGGRPLIAWSIEAARASGLFDIILVSTDDDEIKAVAKQYKVEIVSRPKELAQDNSATHEAVLHAWQALGEIRHKVNCIATLQPTNPFRTLAMLEEAVKLFETRECDSLITVSQQNLKCGEIRGEYYYPSYKFGQQSRLSPPVIYENGLLYLTSQMCLLRGTLSGQKVLPLVTQPPFDNIDIDVHEDFVMAEELASFAKNSLGY